MSSSFSLSTKKYNHYFSHYFLTLDLINKYNTKTVYNLPGIKKIILHFSIEEFLKRQKISNKIETNSNFETKSILLFYIYFSLLPYINLKKFKLKRIKGKIETTHNFSLKICISTKQEIAFFLINIFMEKHNLIRRYKLYFFKQKNKIFSSKFQNICYNSAIPTNFFFEADEILFPIKAKETSCDGLNIKTSFIFTNIFTSKNDNKLITNISYFWMNN